MIKRPLIPISIALILGILAFSLKINMIFICVGIFILSLWTLFFKRNFLPLLLALVITFAAGCARIAYDDYEKNKLLAEFGQDRRLLTLTVTDFSDNGKVVAQFEEDGKVCNIYLSFEEEYNLLPGDIIKARVIFKEPYKSKTSIGDFSTYMASRDVFLFGEAQTIEIVGRQKSGLQGGIYTLRRYIDALGSDNFSGECRGLFNATVLGDKRFISDELDDLLKTSGLSHIAVVSGMHLSVLIAVQMIIFEKLFGKKRIGSLLSIAVALFVTVVTGAGASVVRALIMCIIYQLAKLLRRESDSLTTLSFTVMLMLFYNPYILFNAGFVLSVLSVLGILLYYEKIRSFTGKFLGGPVCDAAAVTISAQLTVTVPMMYYFSVITPYSVLSNVLVSVFVTVLLIVSILLCAFGSIPVVSTLLSFAVKFFSETVFVVCRFIKKLPGSSVNVGNLSAGIVIVWLLVLFVLYIGFKHKDKIRKTVAAFTALFVFCSCVSAIDNNRLKLTFLQYAGNSMTVMNFPTGERVLIDCLNSYDAEELSANEPYDFTILSGNNSRKTEYAVSVGVTKTVIASESAFSFKEKQKLTNKIESFGGEVIFLAKGEYFYYKDISVGYLPTGDKKGTEAVDVEYKGVRFISAVHFSRKNIEELAWQKNYIECDYINPPNLDDSVLKELENHTSGKIIKDKNSFAINLY